MLRIWNLSYKIILLFFFFSLCFINVATHMTFKQKAIWLDQFWSDVSNVYYKCVAAELA